MRLCPIGLRIVGRGLVQVSVASDGADNVHLRLGIVREKSDFPKTTPKVKFGEWATTTILRIEFRHKLESDSGLDYCLASWDKIRTNVLPNGLLVN